MSLAQWQANGWLQRHSPTLAGITQLLEVVERDLADASIPQLSADNRFANAYNAGLQLCVLALHASGFVVAKGQGHHLRSLQSLPLTVSAEEDGTYRYLDACSRKRHQIEYERSGVVEAADADELVGAVSTLRDTVLQWLKRTYPGLVPDGLE